jgi:hypothetical protein
VLSCVAIAPLHRRRAGGSGCGRCSACLLLRMSLARFSAPTSVFVVVTDSASIFERRLFTCLPKALPDITILEYLSA